jgi:hypothetical protein
MELPTNCAARYNRMLARPAVQRMMQQEGLAACRSTRIEVLTGRRSVLDVVQNEKLSAHALAGTGFRHVGHELDLSRTFIGVLSASRD